jgi:glycogen debranching enzyme
MMQPDMWSGWGIRTLSASHKSFNPYNYQTGAVWPCDNAIIALGFRCYGLAAEAGGRKFTSQVAEIATTWAGQYRLGALSRAPRDCSQRQKLSPSAA